MNILSGKLLSFAGSTESSDKECQEGAHFMNFSFQVVKCELQDVKCKLQVVECTFQDLKHKNAKDENERQNAFFRKNIWKRVPDVSWEDYQKAYEVPDNWSGSITIPASVTTFSQIAKRLLLPYPRA